MSVHEKASWHAHSVQYKAAGPLLYNARLLGKSAILFSLKAIFTLTLGNGRRRIPHIPRRMACSNKMVEIPEELLLTLSPTC